MAIIFRASGVLSRQPRRLLIVTRPRAVEGGKEGERKGRRRGRGRGGGRKEEGKGKEGEGGLEKRREGEGRCCGRKGSG